MNHPPRSPTPTHTATTLSKRSFESDTWLILGITIAVFALLSSLGIFILCYRRRGHKRRMDRRRVMAAKSRGNYVQLDGEKGHTEGEEEVPLRDRTTADSPRIIPPPPAERIRSQSQSQSQSNPLITSTAPTEPDMRKNSSPHPHPHPHPQTHPQVTSQPQLASINLQHPQPQGVYLPPVVSHDRGRRQSLRAEYDHGYDYYDDYDGRTGHRFERSRSPSPGRLVLSRSISMLRPREQI